MVGYRIDHSCCLKITLDASSLTSHNECDRTVVPQRWWIFSSYSRSLSLSCPAVSRLSRRINAGRKRIEKQYRAYVLYLSFFLLADAAMSIVSVIICVHGSTILSFRSKVVVVVVVVMMRTTFVEPFFSFLPSMFCFIFFSSLLSLSTHRPFVLYVTERNTKMVPPLLLLWRLPQPCGIFLFQSRANRGFLFPFFLLWVRVCVHVALSLAVPFILFRNNSFSKTNNKLRKEKKKTTAKLTNAC